MPNKPRPDLTFEAAHRAEGRLCVGVDEVGRGCLAGPVVTAAVVLPDFVYSPEIAVRSGRGASLLKSRPKRESDSVDLPWWHWINDSKLVAPALREELAALICADAQVQIAWCLPEEIDQWNILHAAMIAMRRALGPFAGLAQAVLVDGNMNPFKENFRCSKGVDARLGFSHVQTIVKGDQRSLSIAAASIVAKVYRDRWMTELDRLFPDYGFAEHKGYSTPTHYAAIRRLGPCALHRLSFAPFHQRK